MEGADMEMESWGEEEELKLIKANNGEEEEEGSRGWRKEGGGCWVVDKGVVTSVGKKMLVTGFVVTSAPLLVPPLLVMSAIGFVCSVPYGLLFASYACTQKLMSILLPTPPPPPPHHQEYPDGDDQEEEEEEEEKLLGDEPVIKATTRSRSPDHDHLHVIEHANDSYRLPRHDDDYGKETLDHDDQIPAVAQLAGEEEEEVSVLGAGDDDTGRNVHDVDDDKKLGNHVVLQQPSTEEDEDGTGSAGIPIIMKDKDDDDNDTTSSDQRQANKEEAILTQAAAINVVVPDVIVEPEDLVDELYVVVEQVLDKPSSSTTNYADDAREVADESGFHLFDETNAANGQQVSGGGIQQPTDYMVPKAADSLELTIPSGDNGVKHAEILAPQQLNTTDAASYHKVQQYSEEKIWKQIGAMRTIVGYAAPKKATCAEELKSLYIFTGVEPPSSFEHSSELEEMNDKLKFLMSIVGVK